MSSLDYNVFAWLGYYTGDSERLQVLTCSQLVLAVAVQILSTQAGRGEQDT